MEEARSFEAIAFPFTVGLAAGLLLPEQLYAVGGIHLLGGLACLGAVDNFPAIACIVIELLK